MPDPEISAATAFNLLGLVEEMMQASDLPELAQSFLKSLPRLLDTPAAVLYLEDLPPNGNTFFHTGLLPAAVPLVRSRCAARFHPEPGLANLEPVAAPLAPGVDAYISLFPLNGSEKVIGLLGVALPEEGPARALAYKAIPVLLTHPLRRVLERLDYEKRISSLNTYLNVSSMIAQALDLKDVLEAVLYFCMEAVAAEAASVLLLDYEKKNFRFY
ncbi:MAG: hypothetical protein C4567_14865, partial [Deltaproteobacteria bacterium]